MAELNALHKAILDGDVAAVDRICREQPDLNVPSPSGSSCIELARNKGVVATVVAMLRVYGSNTEEQSQLQDLLRDSIAEVSSVVYAAGWLNDIEYDLWRLVNDGPEGVDPYLVNGVLDVVLDNLAFLAGVTDGWVAYLGQKPVFVPRHEWESMYVAWIEQA